MKSATVDAYPHLVHTARDRRANIHIRGPGVVGPRCVGKIFLLQRVKVGLGEPVVDSQEHDPHESPLGHFSLVDLFRNQPAFVRDAVRKPDPQSAGRSETEVGVCPRCLASLTQLACSCCYFGVPDSGVSSRALGWAFFHKLSVGLERVQ